MDNYRTHSEASEGYVFTGVCDSFCPQEGLPLPRMHHWSHNHTGQGESAFLGGGSALLGICLPGSLPFREVRPLMKADPPAPLQEGRPQEGRPSPPGRQTPQEGRPPGSRPPRKADPPTPEEGRLPRKVDPPGRQTTMALCYIWILSLFRYLINILRLCQIKARVVCSF